MEREYVVKKLLKDGYSEEYANAICTIADGIQDSPYIIAIHFIKPETDRQQVEKILWGVEQGKIKSTMDGRAVLSVLEAGINIDALVDTDMEDWKRDAFSQNLHLIKDYERTSKYFVEQANLLDSREDIELITNDILKNINIFQYLRPEFTNQQWKTYRQASLDNDFDARNLVSKMNPNNCDYEAIREARRIGMSNDDLCKLSFDVTRKNMMFALHAKVRGYNIDNLLKEDISEDKKDFMYAFIAKKIPEKKIEEFLNKYDEKFLGDVGRVMICINGPSFKKFCGRLVNGGYENYELDLMSKAAKWEDFALMDILVNNKKPNRNIYDILGKIIEEDELQYAQYPLGKLFYDNGVGKIEKYEPFFRLSNEQTLVLAEAYYDNKITYDQLDLLRNKKFDPDVMKFFCKITEKGIDIEPYLKKASKMKKSDLEASFNRIVKHEEANQSIDMNNLGDER